MNYLKESKRIKEELKRSDTLPFNVLYDSLVPKLPSSSYVPISTSINNYY